MGNDSYLYREVVRLYCDSEMSTRRVAEILGIDRQRVTHILRSEGVEIAPRGVGRNRPLRVTCVIDEAALYDAYVIQRKSSVEIGRKFGISDRFVRSRLKMWGIARRTRGGLNRYDRTYVDTEEIEALYVEKQWSASEVGDQLGTSMGIVLRSAHSGGVLVRHGGTIPALERIEIRLIEALYDDQEVSRALMVHHVPIVGEPGPIWERFPVPVDLSRELLVALYCECGLSTFQIELVTGIADSTIHRRLEDFQIERRGRGGRSPFMRRWHERQRVAK